MGHSLYRGRATERIMASIESHHDQESAEPYRFIMRECATGRRMPDDTAPWGKLGPTAWVCIAVIFALPIGMILGAGAKPCSATCIEAER